VAGTPATNALKRANVTFTEHPYAHDPRHPSFGLEAAEALQCDPAEVFKTLICVVDDAPVVAIVPVLTTVDLKALAKAAGGRKARMAPVADAERWTGYHAGGISPFGQRSAYPTFVDASALNFEQIYVSGGQRGLDVRMAPTDLITVTHAVACDLGRDATHQATQISSTPPHSRSAT
jgi:Cys-tRNA(Pro)/Cys-tRNA(Cys) deacylase